MTDPLERAVAKAPPIIGSGCTQRYDPQALSPDQGAEFADAAALWSRLQNEQSPAESIEHAPAAKGSGPCGSGAPGKEAD
ncbi:hypothetical protein NAU58_09595 [Pseudomonas stutzeri]|uniref:Uncharacterized protein n=1 Tax=Stutzerimonas stutzeri TaxID=316 RepID=A0A2N8S208_STUST|nr:hypothetical protein [Stutzerimonas stutzeri]MCQ4295828.1 hypothetical protein [Stutzerimonas stutzeri]PNF80663.1 hypothetical protein CXK92_10615 [Stutzerimonas stutzeri]